MRIALLNTFFPPLAVGGAEVVTETLARDLVDLGHEVSVLTLAAPRDRAAVERAGGLDIYRLPLRNVFWPLAAERRPLPVTAAFHLVDRANPLMGWSVERALRAIRPQVLHTHNLLGFSTSVWEAAERCGLPVLHTLHDQRLLCHRGSGMTRAGHRCESRCGPCRLMGSGKRAACSSVAAVVGVSRFILERHRRFGFFAGAETSVIHNAVPGAAVVADVGAAGDRVRLGFLGRLTREKGVDTLLEAVATARGQGVQLELAIAGDGPERRALEELARARAVPARFLGRVERDVLLGQIDLMVVPSRWDEPFGLVAIEAAAAGIPVIASARGGLREVVSHGDTGWLFDPDQPHALTELLVAAWRGRDQLPAIGARGRALAARFDRGSRAARYAALYERVIARPRLTALRVPNARAVARNPGEKRAR